MLGGLVQSNPQFQPQPTTVHNVALIPNYFSSGEEESDPLTGGYRNSAQAFARENAAWMRSQRRSQQIQQQMMSQALAQGQGKYASLAQGVGKGGFGPGG